MRLRYLEVLKHQERVNKIMKGTRDKCRGCKALSKVKPTSKSNSHKETNLFGNLHAANSLEFARVVFRNPIFDLKSSRDLHCLRSLGKLFQTLAPAKDVASMPYLTEWIFLDFSLSSFLRAWRPSTISNTSFIISGTKFIFTLKISVTSFWRFLSWIL